MGSPENLSETAFAALADTERDGGLSPRASENEAGSFLRHAASLSMTKTADGLIDPKLVLSWLLSSVGASAFWIGLLVPVREAGALLPQLLTAPHIRAMRQRKWAWAIGSAVQGFAAAGIALAGLFLEGRIAGVAIVCLLGVLALARSVCSVSYKDVLGKTVGKTRRGTAIGLASSVSSFAVILFALVLITGNAERYSVVIGAIALAAALWLVAGAIFGTLREEKTSADAPNSTLKDAIGQLSILREDRQFVRFIVVRGLLVGTALAPPYLVILANADGQSALSRLGALVLASSVAALVSGYVWGRLADRSSRWVLMISGALATVALLAALGAQAAGLLGQFWAAPAIIFVLMLAYNGVRQGRSTYLVDMAPEDARAQYTAVSNTVIGIVLIGSGLFGALASLAGAQWTIAVFAAMSTTATLIARGLKDVQSD